jgi:hypothetical protein
MSGRLGPRFAVEALFLILVAVGLGLADLRPLVIVLVMAGAWLLVSLVELLASRAPRYAPLVETPVEASAPAGPAPAVGVDTEPGVPPGVEAVAPEPALVESEGDVVEPPAGPRRSWFRRLWGPPGETNDVAAAEVTEPPEAEAAEGSQESSEAPEGASSEPANEGEPAAQEPAAEPAEQEPAAEPAEPAPTASSAENS